MGRNIKITSYEDFDIHSDAMVGVDDVSVKYVQNPDCTEKQDDGFQEITLSTRNNGEARFISIKTDNWSVSDETELVELFEDFKKKANIDDDTRKS